MKITFVLPCHGRKAVGGIKVVYEYANNLVARGHHVNIVHPAGTFSGVGKSDCWYKNLIRYFCFWFPKSYGPQEWFELDPRVNSLWTLSLQERFIPLADVIVATAWNTAECVATYGADKGDKYYLIQHFEDWFGDRTRLIATWKLPLHKIVISRWLEEVAFDMGEASFYIPNGLDFEAFGLDIPANQRQPATVIMLYHHLDWKGSAQGIAALKEVKVRYPQLSVTLFGVEKPASGEIPSWMTFVQKPSRLELRKLYNSAAIFVSPSWAEGWALPPAEAMQCGCATVITRIGGHEYAKENVTSLMFEPKDVGLLANSICRLIEDEPLRVDLALNGSLEISQYTWKRATDALETCLKKDYGL